MDVRISRRDRAPGAQRRGVSEMVPPTIDMVDEGIESSERRLSVARYDLEVVRRPIESVRVKSRSARKHPAEQIDRIAESIQQFGFESRS